jgi:2,4-dienoyl-CoA reductase-like NADH-dependent reductase (Old Yellow Enzyme family)
MGPSALFASLAVRGVCLKNRIAISPMWQYAAKNGFPTDWHLMHLGRLADGGAGLVFQEGTSIERRGCGTVGDLGLWDDSHVVAQARLAAIIRDNGSVPGIQLMHAGRKARRKRTPTEGPGPLEWHPDIADWDEWEVIGPSAIPHEEGYVTPRPMTPDDIDTVTGRWADAARRADNAGYEVLEIHAGHGYLLHQFLSPEANHRRDRYGGTFKNRIRMICEVVESVRSVWPPEKPLFVRLSCVDDAGWTMDDTIRLSTVLIDLGVDVIDCTSGGISTSLLDVGQQLHYGYQVKHAARLRHSLGIATMTVGLIVHAQHAEAILRRGDADLVAIGREAIYNPNWPVDAAQKLGVDPTFGLLPPRSRFWLSRRAKSVPGLIPSTFGPLPDITFSSSSHDLSGA